MIRARTLPIALLALLALSAAGPADARVPRDFFGIVPQTPLDARDTNRMKAGGFDTVRLPLTWGAIQRSPISGYDWAGTDHVVTLLSRSGLDFLPFLYGTPRWLSRRETNLPVSSARQRSAWAAFVRAAVERYGPRGVFWAEHAPGTADPVPRNPIRRWQIWNEANFFYFATPASPGRYARLLKITRPAIKGADRGAQIVLSGLFGDPRERPPRAMDAVDFLDRLYRVRGIRATFDGVALHPYAADTGKLRRLTEAVRRVIVRHHDRRTGLYLTEIGWGSQRNPRRVAFEVGRKEQARELRRAYRYLIGHRGRLNLKQVHWFTWKDVRGGCSFCDSSGLFHSGFAFRPKPAWRAFRRIAR